MTPETFRRLLDTYGADLVRWPAGTMASAEAMIASSAELRAEWWAARKLDGLLRAAAPAVTPDRARQLADAVIAGIARSDTVKPGPLPRERPAAAGRSPVRTAVAEPAWRRLLAALWPVPAGGVLSSWRLAGGVAGVLILLLGWAAADSVAVAADTTTRTDIGTLLAEAQSPFDGAAQ